MRKTRLEFCERGTKKEALKFFKSPIAKKIIFPTFYGALRLILEK